MKSIRLILASAALLLTSGCHSTQYKVYEGRNSVYEGRGGTRENVDGIDIWDTGAPPRKYKLMGIIDDYRSGNLLPTLRRKHDVAKTAKEQGADAVIMISSNSEVIGYDTNVYATTNTNGTTTGTATSTPMVRKSSSFAVIKYL